MNISKAHRNTQKAATKKSKKQAQAPKAEQEKPADKVSLSYFPQSPGVMPDARVEFQGKIAAGPTDDRFRVSVPRHFPEATPDADGNFHYTPDDPNFDSVNTYVVAKQTLDIAEKYADREISWAFSDKLDRDQMLIHPHAGKNTANAFYRSDAGSVNFFSYQDKERNLYRTGLQSDVIAHEIGHAVLDSIRPSYIRSFSVPSGGYHESFADMVSFLRALHEPKVLDQLKAETKGDLSKSNVATKLAEQLGQSLVGRPSLRDAVNNHKFADQHFLTYMGNRKADGPNAFGTESHVYANVFTGAFYDLFQTTYDRAAENPDATFHQAVESARDTMGQLLFRATELAPMGNPAYPEMAQAFLQADVLDNDGANSDLIARAFLNRKILTPSQLKSTQEKLSNVPNVRFRKAALKEAGADKFLADRREELGLPSDVDFKFENAFQNKKGETYLNFSSSRQGELDDPDFGTNEGSRFEGVGGLTLLFDAKGKLRASNHDAVTDREMSNIKNHIRERSLAGQFVAFTGANHQGMDAEGESEHNPSLMFTISNDGNGPLLAKAPVVY